MPRGKVGRPGKFDEQRAKVVVDALEEGAPLKVAASRAGISYESLHGWLAKGRAAGRGRLFEFLQATEAAMQTALGRSLSRWEAAGTHDWKAARAYARFVAHRAAPELVPALADPGRVPVVVAAITNATTATKRSAPSLRPSSPFPRASSRRCFAPRWGIPPSA